MSHDRKIRLCSKRKKISEHYHPLAGEKRRRTRRKGKKFAKMLRDYKNRAAILLIADDILGGWGGRRRISDE
jgi:hypothetical protein